MAKDPVARHRRRIKRFTPRRWLPFVALTALIVGAAVIEPNQPSVAPEKVDATLDLATWPQVTGPDSISSAWFCGGGSAAGSDGLAELGIVMANDDAIGASADVTLYDQEGPQATETVLVPARGRARIQASDLIEAEWVGAVVEVRGGRVAVDQEVSGPMGFDTAPCSTEASDRWFVPSGSTIRGAEEYLSLFNPFPGSTSVDVAFSTDTGRRTPRDLRGLTIPGQSVRVVKVGDTVTDSAEIATTVRARTGRLVVGRVQTYDGTGDEIVTDLGSDDEESVTTAAPEGLVSTGAIPLRSTRWVFPGARLGDGVRNQIAIYNPGGEAAEVDLVVIPQDPDLNPEIEPLPLTIRGLEQTVVDLYELPGMPVDADVWVDVRSLNDVPVVAERLAFFTPPSTLTGASVNAGLPLASTQWMVTQAGPTRTRSVSVPIANPGPRDAEIVVYQLSGGNRDELSSAGITVAAGDRRGLDLSDADPAATLVIASSEPVVVSSATALLSGAGAANQPAFAYPEAIVDLPPLN